LPITRQGATEFTYSRFLVPYLSNFEGYSVFMDEDMIAKGDVYELLEHVNEDQSVFVMSEQPKFEWPSFMVFNNAKCRVLTPEYVQDEKNVLFDFAWAEGIGTLPAEWNHAVGISESREDAKLYHYTQGIPYWPECRGLLEDRFWLEEYKAMLESCDWIDLHRNTRHFQPVMARYLRQYGFNLERKQ
jgi:hypothetical protein